MGQASDDSFSDAEQAELRALAAHLRAHRDSLLAQWKASVSSSLSAAAALTVAQFEDHIPAWLDTLEQRLAAEDEYAKAQALAEQSAHAQDHGLQRWQHGYNQAETMREWGHLHLRLLEELERYRRQHPSFTAELFSYACWVLAEVCSEGLSESAVTYARLRQAEAATRVRELEAALEQLHTLERARAQIWREAAHDVRGTVGVISNASSVLNKEELPEELRTQSSRILRRAVVSLHELLSEMVDLARIEAGQERRHVFSFDAAVMLRDFCEYTRPLAVERNLYLRESGPDTLPVEGDPVKVQRIVQNLVLNALNATERGGVEVSWDHVGTEERPRWAVCVRDTGPGLGAGSVRFLEQPLQKATQESANLDRHAAQNGKLGGALEEVASLPSESRYAGAPLGGEGIGLAIVKRLCELLDATLEFHTAAGEGATFRAVFPVSYSRARESQAPPLET